MTALTAQSSVMLALASLHGAWRHMRRHWYRLVFFFMSMALCLAVTMLAAVRIEKHQFPMEGCLPFFTTYFVAIKRCFVALSVFFWLSAPTLVLLLFLTPYSPQGLAHSQRGLRNWVTKASAYLFFVIMAAYMMLVIMVFHFFVPEQEIQAQIGGELVKGQWTFGQIVAMLIWIPVIAAFVFVFRCE